MVLEKGLPGNLFPTISTPFDWQKKNFEDFFAVGALKCGKQPSAFLHHSSV